MMLAQSFRYFTLCSCLIAYWSAGAQDKIALEEIASGFSLPTSITQTGNDRLYVTEKPGYIQIMDTTGVKWPNRFLDIHTKVNSVSSERGLLGLAFHPNYDDNGYFYVDYTNLSGNTVIARYRRDTLNPDMADPNSEHILLTVTQPYANHNGGNPVFGPDGYLYIGFGDGGSAGDPGNRAQNRQVYLGKILRIDVGGGDPYGIPPDNPFTGIDTLVQEIWAYGVRNPWKFTFDRNTGDLWIADVGQDAWEEIDFQPAGDTGGENYGWHCREGMTDYNTTGCPPSDVFIEPVYAYAHAGGGCSGSVTGGYLYRGSRFPYFYGKYLFTDYCTGVFRALYRDTSGVVEEEDLADLQNSEFTAFGQDASGELYVAGASGRIYRFESLVSGVREVAQKPFFLYPNPASNEFIIETEETLPAHMHIFNTLGKIVLQQEVIGGQMVDCAALPAGTYVVEWSSPSPGYQIEKLVILR